MAVGCALSNRILAKDAPARTSHDYGAQTADDALPHRVRDLPNMHAAATECRRDNYQTWKNEAQGQDRSRGTVHARSCSRKPTPRDGGVTSGIVGNRPVTCFDNRGLAIGCASGGQFDGVITELSDDVQLPA